MSLLGRATRRTGMGHAIVHLALLSGWLIPAQAARADEVAPIRAPKRHAPRRVATSGIDRRVKLLSKGLGLDAKQEAELRKVLESQREQVQRVWNDPSLSGQSRIGATLAINDQTADQIRALLNEEQRKKYNPPKQPHDAAASKPDVEAWMNAITPKK
jgi:hypothetical protein